MKKERNTEKDAATKLAKHRLSVLEMAQSLGNISEACRRTGMDRTSFYEWKRRFQTYGLEGLKDLPPIPKSQPNSTTPETEALILECSLQHPAWGCVKLSDFLKLQGVSVSSPTIQKFSLKTLWPPFTTDGSNLRKNILKWALNFLLNKLLTLRKTIPASRKDMLNRLNRENY